MSGIFDDIIANVGEPYKGGKGFEAGTHEVIIGTVEAKQKKTQKNPEAEVIEVTVFDEQDNDKTATCTLYFHTDGGAKMSVTKVLGIMVHNVGEEKKDAVRELGKKLFGDISDPTKARDIALKLMNDKMIGKKAYLVSEPRNGYPTSSYGDLWHYAVESKTEILGGENVTEELADDLPEFGDL